MKQSAAGGTGDGAERLVPRGYSSPASRTNEKALNQKMNSTPFVSSIPYCLTNGVLFTITFAGSF